MKYRKLGIIDKEISALGFGAMRLPFIESTTRIDEEETTKMVHYAIDHGVNYFDTAYPYHDGNSEIILGKILRKGLRNKIKLADKMPCWLIESPKDFDTYLNEQLKKLQTDHLEFYLLHALFSERWKKVYELDVLSWAEKAIKDGRIGYFGFSVHDSFPVFKGIVDAYDKWDFCQIQYNYMNENVQVGTEGLKYAHENGLPILVMEPLLGGMLTKPPAKIQTIWDNAGKNPVDLALRWLWNKPEVSLVLSGMSNLEQVKQNIEIADNSGVNTLTENDLDFVDLVKAEYSNFKPIPCTKCRYCMPCPNGVDIPRNLELYSEEIIYDQMEMNKVNYNFHMPDKNKACSCTGCRICEDKCPQHITISEWMPRIHNALVFQS